jgi:ABC-type uncharacterized transport system substrate-binding protein
VNVIVTATDAATRAVTEATGTIPILIVGVNYDPVARGFAASLARPGRKSAPIYRARRDIAQLALKHRLPTSFACREYVDAGGLLAYGVNFSSMFRRAAEYVARTAPVSTPSRWHSLARG